ncbi:hypothetical protein GUITHDRAFT_105658 [Guillardia theta CCMP2712]|uniref:Progestin and adipoQ receptor family member 4 n=1 Tax=Guillardia theta (strain CCMP2712) TaxID=905079 RepID=L1JJL6_GUITC|nr:hypothetical protein GUITHDRAFT_105658 [Guillardia theta CCMP2712]EKX48512.1 hypothetical protein GUITHDRAFT_105658 [Guillardia theta CCMP2712]|eukprot:XP_005835492.1 hypothetical protein GUITHDRAFT_105658 [Guillardia theta CCMP2712]
MAQLGKKPQDEASHRRSQSVTSCVESVKGRSKRTDEANGKSTQRFDYQLLLVAAKEVDPHLAFNKYILHGYRHKLTPMQCILSVFQIHNETGNIWTHMLPIAFFVSHLVLHGPWQHAPLFYLAATVPCVLCLTCSSIYHTFMPLSSGEKTYSTLLFIDYLSVFNVMVWPEVVSIYWSFYCDPSVKLFMFVVYFSITVLCLGLALRARTVKERLLPFGIQSLARGISLIFRMTLGYASKEATLLYLATEFLGIAGGMINAMRAPESIFPGMFDTWLNSHQIMHILTAMAQFCVFYACQTDYEYWQRTSCLDVKRWKVLEFL